MKVLYFGTMASVAMMFAATAARADERPGDAKPAEHKMPANDREFVIMAATGGHAEVQFGELAEKRAGSEKVKEFAARMIKDHRDANQKLAEHSKNQKIAVAAGFDREQRDMYKNISRLSGADFDRAYMKMMVEDHEHDVKMFEHEATHGTDAELKKFAESSLPTLREHLKMAREVNEIVAKK